MSEGSCVPWAVLEKIREAGGRPLLVGGAVRDLVMAHSEFTCFSGGGVRIDFGADLEKCKDLDFEVHNLNMGVLEEVLSIFGEVDTVGRSFGVLKLHTMGHVDFSVPRRDNKVGIGHTGFKMEIDPFMSFADATKRRDLTINSMMLDLFSGDLIDLHGGLKDLKVGALRATDASTFLDDPLRALRVAQFISRFDFRPDAQLTLLCDQADLSQLPGERLHEEFKKLLLGKCPHLGIDFLRDTKLLRFFPELQALHGCEQHPIHHPEGDALIHTMLAVKVARELTDDPIVLFSVLCHDLGKPSTTKMENGKLTSKGHDVEGQEPTERFLTRLCCSNDFIAKVKMLVKHHLDPILFPAQGAGAKAYRKLARELFSVGLNFETLHLVSTADRFGRATPDALARNFEKGREFMDKVSTLDLNKIADKPYSDVVLGRHVIARGVAPGPMIGNILKLCREAQDESGLTDPEAILDGVMGKRVVEQFLGPC